MRLYNYNIILLLKRLFIAVFLFFISRAFFLVYNLGLYTDITFVELLKVFFFGIRFDISAICYFNLLFIIFHIIPWNALYRKKPFQLVLKLYFVIVNIILTLGNLGDSIYFHFTQKRSTADIFKLIFISDDIFILLPSFIADYWYIPVLVVILGIVIWKIYPSYNPSEKTIAKPIEKRYLSIIYQITLMLILLGLTVIGGRGGLQLKPLSIIDASKNVRAKHMPLVLNSIFTSMTTYGKNNLEKKSFFSDEKCQEIYPVVHYPNSSIKDFQNHNIVVILLESFSREYIGFLNDYSGFTPFLDSLADHSMVFTNAFSNGLRSIDAIPAIVASVPMLMDDPFITSIYSTNQTVGLVEILNGKGYHSAFFHGGNNGTMNFDGFAEYAGFKEYYGRDEYGDDNDYDDYWGIYDEPFLQFFASKLNLFPEPFFAFEFTLSSHYPYSIPDKHKGRFVEGPMLIHKVVRYSDYSLMKFFETAQKMSWYNNTLFFILADHPAQSVIPTSKEQVIDKSEQLDPKLLKYYKNTSGRYAIPLLVFAPGDTNFIGKSEKTVQQTDIMPTVLNYLNYNEPYFSLGYDMFDDSNNGVCVHFVNGLYQITSGDYSLLMNNHNSISLFNNVLDPDHKNNLLDQEAIMAEELETKLKAIVQHYTNRMINNNLVVDK